MGAEIQSLPPIRGAMGVMPQSLHQLAEGIPIVFLVINDEHMKS